MGDRQRGGPVTIRTTICPSPNGLVLLPHQDAELAFLLKTPRALLFSETGCGKTPVLLAYAGEVLRRGGMVVAVTGKGLVPQFRAEAARWLPDHPAPVDPADEPLTRNSPFVVMSHELAQKRSEAFSWIRPGLLVIDEANAVGTGIDPRAKTFRALLDLSKRSKRSVLTTATPVTTAHGLEMWALLEVGQIPCRPTRVAFESLVTYRDIYGPSGQVVRTPDTLTELGRQALTGPLKAYSVRTTTEQVGAAIPTVRTQYRSVPLTGSARSDYDTAEHVPGLAGHHQRQNASRSAEDLIPALVEFMTTGEGREHDKAVIFSDNFDLIDPIALSLSRAGWKAHRITGKESQTKRAKAVAAWREDSHSALVISGAGENGLNLQASGLLVSVVQSWSPAREKQREGRCARIGSPFAEVLHAVIRPDASIEVRRDERHDMKRELAERILSAVPLALSLAASDEVA